MCFLDRSTISLTLVPIVLPTLLLLLSIGLWLIYHGRTLDPSIKLPLPPGSMGLPFLGETPMLALWSSSFYEKRRQRYGDIFKTHILGSPVIRVAGADNVRKVLMNEHSLVTVCWPRSVRILLGDGTVANAVGELHTSRRRALQKAFTYNALSDYMRTIQKIVRNHLTTWCNQDSILAHEQCKHMAFAMACEVLLGFKMNAKEYQSVVDVFTVWVDNLFSLPYNFPGFGFAKALPARATLLKKIEEGLEKKQKQLSQTDEDEIEGTDALSRILKNDQEDALTDNEIKEISLELLFAGHATTSSALSSLLIHLEQNREVIAKVQEELDQNGLWPGEDGDLNLHTLHQLPYVAAVIKEVLRILPPVGETYRKVLKSFSLNGYQIPAGWKVAIDIRQTQNNSQVFTDRETFDPERWLSCDYEKEAKFHYLPFGGGSRTCVGKELAKIFLKVFVVELVRTCSWSLAGDSVKMAYIPIPHPMDGLPARFVQLPSGCSRSCANSF